MGLGNAEEEARRLMFRASRSVTFTRSDETKIGLEKRLVLQVRGQDDEMLPRFLQLLPDSSQANPIRGP